MRWTGRRPVSASSSEEITWLTGSWTVGPGITSSSVGSPSEALGRRARERDVLFSGVCLLRVAVLTAVMIWRVMQSSAKLRKLDSRSVAVVADRLVEADEPLLDEIVAVAAGQEVRRRLQAHEAVVAPDETVVRGRIALLGKRDQVPIINLNLRLRMRGKTGHERSFRTRRRPCRRGRNCAQWRNPPRSASCMKSQSRLNLRSSLSKGEVFRLMDRCQAVCRRCKIPYSRAAAAALALSDCTCPRSGSATSWSHAAATRGRSPRPSAPITSTQPPL